MAFHNYQVTYGTNGEVEQVVLLPDDSAPRKRTIVVREETHNKAKHTAENLYSLAT